LEKEITERKAIETRQEKTRKELEVIKIAADEAYEFIDDLINTVREPLITLDHDLQVVSANRSFYDFFEVKPEETKGHLIYNLGNKQWDIPQLRELLETILPQKKVLDDYEVEHNFETIGRRTMLLNARRIEQNLGKKGIILLAIEDITARKQAEEQINANLKEKETLLKEIHHRVKNNMTVISSLLKLQMDKTDNTIAKEALLDSQNRVKSMSMIHETLYRSDNLSAIDLKTYLSELGKTVFQNYTISNKVQFIVEAENIMIGAKQASPVGLIVNELIANCLKYAFSDGREGEILLELKSDKEKGVELSLSDNGVGIPEGFDLENADSLGLKLVKVLVENQLYGSIDMESKNGTKFTIKFNIDQT